MIPILFPSTETSFTTNGLGRLADCTRCEVTEERNGVYECEFDYPVSGKLYDQIAIGTYIAVTHDDKGDIQPFEIYMRTAPLNGLVTFNARHISYKLGTIVAKPFTASSCAAALAAIPNNAMTSCPFTFWTDKSVTASFALTNPKTIRSILGGSEGSILDVFGTAEYEWDMFTVKLHQHRGQDSGVTIRYGKNLLDLTQTVDAENLYNAAVGYWEKDGDTQYGAVTKGTGVTAAAIAVTLDFSGDFETKPTKAQLNAKAKAFLDANQPWIPKENIKVDFVQLWQTEDYKDVAALQRVGLCDTVSVIYPELGVTAENVKVIAVTYDTLRDRYSEMELGEAKSSFAEVIRVETEALVADKPSISMMDAAIAHATELIRGGLGGHVVISTNADGEPEEILIMDTDDVNTAQKVWRFNLGGLGYSSTGVSGPYGTAITQDGEIVASFITAGIMNANVIRAGVLQDQQGANYWDLETGEFRLSTMPTINLMPSIYRREYQSPAVTTSDGWTSGGVKWNVDPLGRVTAEGTATSSNSYFLFTSDDLTNVIPRLTVDPGKKHFLQGCPQGGSPATYCLIAKAYAGDGTAITSYIDSGSGVVIPDGASYLYIYARVWSGTTVNITYHPMLSEGTTRKSYQSTHGAEGQMNASIKVNADGIATEVTQRTNADGALQSQITQNAGQIALKVNTSDYTATNIVNKINGSSLTIDPDNISLVGKTINLTSDNIAINSTNFSVTKAGKVTATSGEIGPWNFSGSNFWRGEEKVNGRQGDGTHAAIVPDGITFARYFWLTPYTEVAARRILADDWGVYLQVGVPSTTPSDPATYSGPWTWTTISSYTFDTVSPTTGSINDYISRANITKITAGDIATGKLLTTGQARLFNSSGVWRANATPQFWFWRSDSTTQANTLALLFANTQTVNGKACMERFYIREYSYDASTGDQKNNWENYYLPTVNAGRTTNASYQILTTKTVAKNTVTYSATVNFAANETKNITLTGTLPSGYAVTDVAGIIAQNTGDGNVVFVTISQPNTATSMGVACRNFSSAAANNCTVSVTYRLIKGL